MKPENLQPGKYQFEHFTIKSGRLEFKKIQYDYRAKDGELFSCVANTLDECLQKRDNWLIQRELQF